MNEQYKENLLQNARYQMKQTGGKVITKGHGFERKIKLRSVDGRSCVVWYPTESRVNGIEITDMKDAIKEMGGQEAFAMK